MSIEKIKKCLSSNEVSEKFDKCFKNIHYPNNPKELVKAISVANIIGVTIIYSFLYGGLYEKGILKDSLPRVISDAFIGVIPFIIFNGLMAKLYNNKNEYNDVIATYFAASIVGLLSALICELTNNKFPYRTPISLNSSILTTVIGLFGSSKIRECCKSKEYIELEDEDIELEDFRQDVEIENNDEITNNDERIKLL